MSGYYEPLKYHGTKAEYEAEIQRFRNGKCEACIFSAPCEASADLDDGEITHCWAILLANIEHVPPPHWRAEVDEPYWYVGDGVIVTTTSDVRWDCDDNRYAIGNYFRTKEDAERAAERIKAAYERTQAELEGADND